MEKIVNGSKEILDLDNEVIITRIFCNKITAEQCSKILKMRERSVLDEDEIYGYINLFTGVPIVLDESLNDGKCRIIYDK